MEEQLAELKRVCGIKQYRENEETFWAWILNNFTPKVNPFEAPVSPKVAEKKKQFRKDAITTTELLRWYGGEPKDNALDTCLTLAGHIMELTNE